MADGNGHPFNSDVIADETIVQFHKQLTTQQRQPPSKNQPHKNLLDLLASNNTSNHFLNAADPSINISSQAVTDDEFNRLKSLVRSSIWPVDHLIRRQLWMNILTLNRVSTSKKQQASHVHHPIQTPIPAPAIMIDANRSPASSSSSKLNHWPSFVETSYHCFYHLTEPAGQFVLQRVLFTFALHHPDVTYCPAVEPFSSLLLHYFNEHEVLYLINRLLNKHWLCGETRLQWEANGNVFKQLLSSYYVSLMTTTVQLFHALDLSRNRPPRLCDYVSPIPKSSTRNGSGGYFVIYHSPIS